jgi:hypothetical protein
MIELISGHWGPAPKVIASGPPPSGSGPIDFRYQSQPKSGPARPEHHDADLLKTRTGYRAGYRVTFPAGYLPANSNDSNHFICVPVVQGENPAHYLSYLDAPIWQYGIGVIATLGGIAFEIWTGDGSASIWSDFSYFHRIGISRFDAGNDPAALVKNYTGPQIGYRAGYNGYLPRSGNLTLACEVVNVGVIPGAGDGTWLTAVAWASDDPGYWLTWGSMNIPTYLIAPGLALRQAAGKTMPGRFEAHVDLSYYTA